MKFYIKFEITTRVKSSVIVKDRIKARIGEIIRISDKVRFQH